MKKQVFFIFFAIATLSLICTALEPFSTSVLVGSVVFAGGAHSFVYLVKYQYFLFTYSFSRENIIFIFHQSWHIVTILLSYYYVSNLRSDIRLLQNREVEMT